MCPTFHRGQGVHGVYGFNVTSKLTEVFQHMGPHVMSSSLLGILVGNLKTIVDPNIDDVGDKRVINNLVEKYFREKKTSK